MNVLISNVKEILVIPYIPEDGVIFDGSFTVAPVISTGLRGNGEIKHSSTCCVIDLFYKDNAKLVQKATMLWKKLSELKYVCGEPDYVYEKNAKVWRAHMQIGGINYGS